MAAVVVLYAVLAHPLATALATATQATGSNYSWTTRCTPAISVGDVRLGKALRHARTAAGLTQEALAFRAGVSRNYISLVELDEKSPTIATLARVCRALNVRVSKLIEDAEGRSLRR